MSYRSILLSLARIMALLSLAMLVPLALSYYYGEHQQLAFIIPISIGLVVGTLTWRRSKGTIDLSRRGAMLTVVLSWVLASALGAIPFLLSQTFSSVTDAFFEAISGFTATGSTVLEDIERLPQSLLFWRSETHWLGGMGIIILAIAIFPSLSGKRILFDSEAPTGPVEEKILPRIAQVAKMYWKIYVFLTVVEILLLWPAIGWFDATTHSFASIAGGGFSTKNLSISHFHSFYVELVVIFFMIAGATSFVLHYYALLGNAGCYLKSTAFKMFIALIGFATIFIAFSLMSQTGLGLGFFAAVRASLFQVVSIVSTTGFATADFNQWPVFSQLMLVALMFIGGMSSSTSGSIKVSRYEIMFKDLWLSFRRLLHHRSVSFVKVGRKVVPPNVVIGSQLYFFVYLLIALLSSLILIAIGNAPSTAFSAVAATIGNVGPGIGTVGPFDNYAHFSLAAKWILSGCMLIGRLEIWTVLMLFLPEFWIL